MLRISDLLDPRSVEASLAATAKREAIEEMVAVLARSTAVPEPERLARELLERERLASTGVGGGIALPHKLLEGFGRSAMALGRSRSGIPFDAADGQLVTVLFLIVGPVGQHAEHLRLLSRLARLLRDETLARELVSAPDAAGMLAALGRRDAE